MAVTHPLLNSPVIQGFCYTQLTDVEQEINGLLAYDRKPKVPLEIIRQINDGQVPEGYEGYSKKGSDVCTVHSAASGPFSIWAGRLNQLKRFRHCRVTGLGSAI
jgi:hypothetical protein